MTDLSQQQPAWVLVASLVVGIYLCIVVMAKILLEPVRYTKRLHRRYVWTCWLWPLAFVVFFVKFVLYDMPRELFTDW